MQANWLDEPCERIVVLEVLSEITTTVACIKFSSFQSLMQLQGKTRKNFKVHSVWNPVPQVIQHGGTHALYGTPPRRSSSATDDASPLRQTNIFPCSGFRESVSNPSKKRACWEEGGGRRSVLRIQVSLKLFIQKRLHDALRRRKGGPKEKSPYLRRK